MGASLSGEMHGGDCGHPYDDFWSWDIKEGKWTRERMVGNTPCPRSEAACVYNPKWNKTVVWGGYHPDLPTDVGDAGMSFSFSYFADTFIYDGPPTTTATSTNTNTNNTPPHVDPGNKSSPKASQHTAPNPSSSSTQRPEEPTFSAGSRTTTISRRARPSFLVRLGTFGS